MDNPNNFKKYRVKTCNILKAIDRRKRGGREREQKEDQESESPKQKKNTSVKVLETKRNEAQGSKGHNGKLVKGDKIKRGRNGVASTCKKCTKFEVHRK